MLKDFHFITARDWKHSMVDFGRGGDGSLLQAHNSCAYVHTCVSVGIRVPMGPPGAFTRGVCYPLGGSRAQQLMAILPFTRIEAKTRSGETAASGELRLLTLSLQPSCADHRGELGPAPFGTFITDLQKEGSSKAARLADGAK